MKCINKKTKKNRKLRNTLLLVFLLMILALAGVLSLLFAVKNKGLKEAMPYDRSIRAFGTSAKEDALVAEGLAKNLCVENTKSSANSIQAQAGELAALFDISNKEILFSQGLYEKISAGRITQLMAALTAYEALNMDDSVTVEQSDISYEQGSVFCGLAQGDTVLVRQLINAVLVSSADDACFVLARTAGGSKEAFVNLMNEKARELGMTNTQFTNVTGRSDEGQYTTVYDVYLLLNALTPYPDITNALGLSNYTLNYSKADGKLKQQWLDSKNPYITERISVPKGITVLGGSFRSSDSGNHTALLVQNAYGDVYAAVVMQADSEVTMNQRIREMLETINSQKLL